jgi:hypothetical protein
MMWAEPEGGGGLGAVQRFERPAALRQSRVQVLRLPRVPYSEVGVFRLSRDGGLAAPSIIYKCEMVRLLASRLSAMQISSSSTCALSPARARVISSGRGLL